MRLDSGKDRAGFDHLGRNGRGARHWVMAMEQWYALYTKPNAERHVTDALMTRGLGAYLPTLPVWRARRRRIETEPFFACYTFARMDLEAVGISAVAWIPGLRSLVSCDGKPAAIPDSVMAYVRQRVEKLAAEGATGFRRGETVRITHGPFKDMEAIFDRRLSSVERAQVLVEVLGRLTRAGVPINCLGKR